MSGMRRIRDYYRVPAKRGMRVVFDGKPGLITSACRTSMHLFFRADGAKRSVRIHPTWHVDYGAGASE